CAAKPVFGRSSAQLAQLRQKSQRAERELIAMREELNRLRQQERAAEAAATAESDQNGGKDPEILYQFSYIMPKGSGRVIKDIPIPKSYTVAQVRALLGDKFGIDPEYIILKHAGRSFPDSLVLYNTEAYKNNINIIIRDEPVDRQKLEELWQEHLRKALLEAQQYEKRMSEYERAKASLFGPISRDEMRLNAVMDKLREIRIRRLDEQKRQKKQEEE
ncbi:MAG: hypothetical protein ACYCOU_18170, partial [Sulfobacillus sp.]